MKRLNEIFDGLKLEKHPDKSFDFLGYHFSREGLTMTGDTCR